MVVADIIRGTRNCQKYKYVNKIKKTNQYDVQGIDISSRKGFTVSPVVIDDCKPQWYSEKLCFPEYIPNITWRRVSNI